MLTAMHIYLHMTDGTTRTIEYNPHEESPFQALQRIYRSENGDDFMVSELASVTFEMDGAQRGVPHIPINLAEMQNRPNSDEWELREEDYGRDLLSIQGTRTPDSDGHTVWMNKRGWTRAELPELIAFLSAVYTASEDVLKCRQCGVETDGEDFHHSTSGGMLYCAKGGRKGD